VVVLFGAKVISRIASCCPVVLSVACGLHPRLQNRRVSLDDFDADRFRAAARKALDEFLNS